MTTTLPDTFGSRAEARAQMLETRTALINERAQLLAADPNTFDAAKQARFDAMTADIDAINAREAEITANDERVRRDAAARGRLGAYSDGGDPTKPVSGERMTAGGIRMQIQDRARPEVYTARSEHSFFSDLLQARLMQDRGAWERLQANQEAQGRAISTASGSAGQFAPPLWLVEEYVKLARPARVTADVVTKRELPMGVSSINLPKVATGTTVGVTQTQNTAISNTDITSTSVSSSITTISGQQVLSIESIRQSGADLDRVILADLALAVAATLETQVLIGSGSNGQLLGIANVSGANAVTYTTSAPKLTTATNADSLYYQLVKAQNAISTNRYLAPTAIVMHPRRWAYVSTQLDTTNRPIVPASSAGETVNSVGSIEAVAASGRVGTLAGLPVFTSAQVPTNLGVATNQDQIYVLRAPDLTLWESSLSLEIFDSTYANQNSILVRALEFAAFIPHRYAASVSIISGTGLVDPGLS